jgi:hypothetical protein
MAERLTHYALSDDPMTQVRVGKVMVSLGELDSGEQLIYLGVANPDGTFSEALLSPGDTAELIADLASTLAISDGVTSPMRAVSKPQPAQGDN